MEHSTTTKYIATAVHGIFRLRTGLPSLLGARVIKRIVAHAPVGILVFSMACGPVVRTDHVTTDESIGADRYEITVRTDGTLTGPGTELGSKLEVLATGQQLAFDRLDSSSEYESGEATFKLRVNAQAAEVGLQIAALTTVASELGIIEEPADRGQMLASAGKLTGGPSAASDPWAVGALLANPPSAPHDSGRPATFEAPAVQVPTGAIQPASPTSLTPGANSSPSPIHGDPDQTGDSDPNKDFDGATSTTDSDSTELEHHPDRDSLIDVNSDSSSGDTLSAADSAPGKSGDSNTGGNGNGNSSDDDDSGDTSGQDSGDASSDDDSDPGNAGDSNADGNGNSSDDDDSGDTSGQDSGDTSSDDDDDSGDTSGQDSGDALSDDDEDSDDDSAPGNVGDSNAGGNGNGNGSSPDDEQAAAEQDSGDGSAPGNSGNSNAGGNGGNGGNGNGNGNSSDDEQATADQAAAEQAAAEQAAAELAAAEQAAAEQAAAEQAAAEQDSADTSSSDDSASGNSGNSNTGGNGNGNGNSSDDDESGDTSGQDSNDTSSDDDSAPGNSGNSNTDGNGNSSDGDDSGDESSDDNEEPEDDSSSGSNGNGKNK